MMPDDAVLSLDKLDGRLRLDAPAREAMKTDFGGMLTEIPSAVLEPGSPEDIAAALKEAGRRGVPVTVRGLGRSVYGQTVARPGGVLIDMSSLNRVHAIGRDRCVVDAGATWATVVKAALAQGLVPPVLIDFLDLTVGGTLSWGGMGMTSRRYGLQADNVLELEVATADGMLHRCSPSQESDLFHAVLGGMGTVGVMTKVTLALIPAPERALRVQIPYPDAAAMTAGLMQLAHDDRVDAFQGIVAAPDGQWVHLIEATAFYSGERPDVGWVCEGLNGMIAHANPIDSSFEDFLFRLGDMTTLPCQAAGPHAHPWWSTQTSAERAPAFVEELEQFFDPATAGPFDLLIVYPMLTGRSRTPLPSLPRQDWSVVVATFWCVSFDRQDQLAAVLAENRRLFEQAAAVHAPGSVDPVAAVDYSPAEWAAHLADAWPAFDAAKRKYDPQGVLDKARRIF
ncbi:hypothetical protein L288_14730 [Sphingobium quisquiliarum P25]|uniref:FAD-binding PCMH-type domain-containing protein n=1 Tax=Sphingobium quisquiliarum P25 TaxID=1329909 RepID=T0GS49_9SPHN|nr:FAD-binding protein [Sphingobium quisquiliarum]EQB03512.1 hypothetical protein L288_14730 [Sphingobium quisquiliarum P25]